MAIIGENYSGIEDPVQPSGETEFISCNFAMPSPVDVSGDKEGHLLDWESGLTFNKYTFTNREPPAGSTIIGKKPMIIDYCYETSSEDINYDSVKITEIKEYANRVYGYFDTDTWEYVYFPEPKDYPVKEPD